MRTKIIAIDGIDGSGKTSLISKLNEELKYRGFLSMNMEVKNRDSLLVENYDQRKLLRENQYMKLSAYMFDLLFNLNNIQNCEYVIFDRYVMCLDAYFGCLGIEIPWVNKCQELVHKPYRTYILDLPVQMALERIDKRGERRGKLETHEFLTKVRKKRLETAKDSNYQILDATLGVERPCKMILEDIDII